MTSKRSKRALIHCFAVVFVFLLASQGLGREIPPNDEGEDHPVKALGTMPITYSGFEGEDGCLSELVDSGYIGGGANANPCGEEGACYPANCGGMFHVSTLACADPPDCDVCWINPISPRVVFDPEEAFAGDQFLRLEFDPAQPEGVNMYRNYVLLRPIRPAGCLCHGCGDPAMCCDPEDLSEWDPQNACCLPEGDVTFSMWIKFDCNMTQGRCDPPQPLNRFEVFLQAPTQGIFTANVSFRPNGTIVIIDKSDPKNDGFTDVTVPGVDWTETLGQWVELRICLDDPNRMFHPDNFRSGRIRYFFDGLQIYSTDAGEGGFGSGVFWGSIIENAIVSFGRLWLGGPGNFNDGFSMQIDEFLIEPGVCPEQTGACCLNEAGCEVMTNSGCLFMGGTFLGPDAGCPVDVNTLLMVILNWGCTSEEGKCPGDFDGDGVVGVGDLTSVILAWGGTC